MWRTFPGTPIGPLGISFMVVVCIGLRAVALQRSKADRDLLRVAHSTQWATIGLLLVAPLLFGIGCRSHELGSDPSIELIKVPHSGAGWPDQTEHIGRKATGAQSGQNIVAYGHSGIGRVKPASYSPFAGIQTDATCRNSTYLAADYTAVDFVIKRDFWQSSCLRITCLGLGLVIAIFFYRCRMFQSTHQLNIRFQERLAERTRMAQELHDTLLQSFQGLILRFQIATETVLSDPLEAKELLEQALNRADQALAESRKAIQGIRSVASAGHGLADSLNAMMNGLVEEFCCGKTPPLTTSVVTEGQPRTVNSWITEEVCRIAREALLNSLSHARAQRIESEVAYSDRFLRLRFRDDGIGIDSEILKNGGRKGHWGMTGMYERAKSVHARLSIWSKPGAGTEVELTIPAYIAYDAAPARGRFRLSKRKEQTHHVEQL
jgi:two-component sensor histidine kinase